MILGDDNMENAKPFPKPVAGAFTIDRQFTYVIFEERKIFPSLSFEIALDFYMVNTWCVLIVNKS